MLKRTVYILSIILFYRMSEDKGNNDEDDDFDSEVSTNFQTPARNTRSRTLSSLRKFKHSSMKNKK